MPPYPSTVNAPSYHVLLKSTRGHYPYLKVQLKTPRSTSPFLPEAASMFGFPAITALAEGIHINKLLTCSVTPALLGSRYLAHFPSRSKANLYRALVSGRIRSAAPVREEEGAVTGSQRLAATANRLSPSRTRDTCISSVSSGCQGACTTR